MIAERFFARCQYEANTGCIFWDGHLDERGYGRVTLFGQTLGVHRLSWEIHNGPIPDDLWVLHRCDTPPCVNPDHLFLGTNQDNIDDYWRKRGLDPSRRDIQRDWLIPPKRRYRKSEAARKPISPDGRHGTNRVLTIDQVREIRASTESGVALSARYGVSTGTISKIRNRRLWSNLP